MLLRIVLTDEESRLLAAINQYRAERARFPLQLDDMLQREARRSVGQYNHRIQGRWVWERLQARGFEGFATDNIARGDMTPEEAVALWGGEVRPSGHEKQMLGFMKVNGQWVDREFNIAGVAVDGGKFIAIFGRRTD